MQYLHLELRNKNKILAAQPTEQVSFNWRGPKRKLENWVSDRDGAQSWTHLSIPLSLLLFNQNSFLPMEEVETISGKQKVDEETRLANSFNTFSQSSEAMTRLPLPPCSFDITVHQLYNASNPKNWPLIPGQFWPSGGGCTVRDFMLLASLFDQKLYP